MVQNPQKMAHTETYHPPLYNTICAVVAWIDAVQAFFWHTKSIIYLNVLVIALDNLVPLINSAAVLSSIAKVATTTL